MLNNRLDLFVRFCHARSSLYSELKLRLAGNEKSLSDVALHSILDMFEFLYMLSVTGINSADQIGSLAKAHNAECERLLKLDKDALTALGLNRTKIDEVVFSDKNIKKIASNLSLIGAIDQSDIARLLFKHMSRETARKVLILFDHAGLVTRIDAGGSVLIRPNGEAERLFEQYLISLMCPPDEGSEDPAKRL